MVRQESSVYKKICNFLARMRTMTLVNILLSIALLILLLVVVFQKHETYIIQDCLVALSFFFGGLSGLPIIFRREVNYMIISFDGLPAVLIGIVISLAGFMVSIGLFIGILRSFAN
jgi:hypothetical protein